MDKTLRYWRKFYAKEESQHVHHVVGLFKGGKEYFIHIEEKSKGTGVVKCEDSLVEAAVKAQAHFDNKMDYKITIIPKLQRKSKSLRLSKISKRLQRSPSQRGGLPPYPPDMNPEGCENLQLNLGAEPITAIKYTEPVLSALQMCGYIGILSSPTPQQTAEIESYRLEHPVTRDETLVANGCMIGRIAPPSFEQFRSIFDAMYNETSTDFNLIIRQCGLDITQASWDDGSYEVRILLHHLHTHAYAHNGIETPEDITQLTDLLGGISRVTAHVVHSLLHTYDSLYMHNRISAPWKFAMHYLGETITLLIPNPVERRCYFRLLNKDADRFLVKVGDGVPVTYRAPYAITDEALPDKERQYGRSVLSLVAPLGAHIANHEPMAQTGTTQLLPNVD
jgi:hypothetical protein